MEIFKIYCCNSSFRNTIRVSNNLDQDQAYILLGLIRVKAVYKDQQTTKFDTDRQRVKMGIFDFFYRYSQIFVVDSEPRNEMLVSC